MTFCDNKNISPFLFLKNNIISLPGIDNIGESILTSFLKYSGFKFNIQIASL